MAVCRGNEAGGDIYDNLSLPYYAMLVKPQPHWGIPRDSESMHSLLFFDPKLQQTDKGWLRQLLEPVNPYRKFLFR
ncbi:MAG: hypothetical protein F6K36_21690 [Symploca sp. SIO3C6]|nr:hypothetical protein [Symploca sp. SIO3C6]